MSRNLSEVHCAYNVLVGIANKKRVELKDLVMEYNKVANAAETLITLGTVPYYELVEIK